MTKEKTKTKALLTVAQLYTTTAQIEAAAKAAVKTGLSLEKQYQRIACSAIQHLGTHKDIRVIRNILANMPASLRKNAMAAFFDKYAQVRVDEKGELHYDAKRKPQLGLALENAWHTSIKDQVYKPFDFEAAIAKVIDQAEKRLEKGLRADKGDKLDKDQLKAIKALISHTQPAVKAVPSKKAA